MAQILFYILMLFVNQMLKAQDVNNVDEKNINNLVHTQGYKTSFIGALPDYIKSGKGPKNLILIPGWGFDASVFQDFMEANKDVYTMFAITIPGYGESMAPPMSESGTSYGAQTWNKGVEEGILKLIKKENIKNVVIVGHSTQGTQLALRMAIDYPTIVQKVIVLGGHAKFIAIMQGESNDFPLETMITYTDSYTAPIWFKTISRQDFDTGNYLPEIYSLDSLKGSKLWKQVEDVPLPVMIEYICEFFASDIKTELFKIKCPVLILRAMFNQEILDKPINNYVKPQFIDCWNGVAENNNLIKVIDIKDAATCVWKDQPTVTYAIISKFLEKH